MDIYSILASKPHNPHYLKRYIKFITWCKQNPTTDEYIEAHHICPKADDLFPEYKSFRDNPWNKVSLSARQHYVAHLILAHTFSKSSASIAFVFISRIQSIHISSREYNTIKKNCAEFIRKQNSGMVPVRDTNTNVYHVVTKEQYVNRDSNIVHNCHGTVPVIDLITGQTTRISIDDYTQRDSSVIKSTQQGKVIVRDKITGEKFTITKVEYDALPENTNLEFHLNGQKLSKETIQKLRRKKKTSENMRGKKSESHKENMKAAKKLSEQINRVCSIKTKKEYATNVYMRHYFHKETP